LVARRVAVVVPEVEGVPVIRPVVVLRDRLSGRLTAA